MLRSVIATVAIGALGGLWVALINDSVEVFQNYVDGAWRYQIAVGSAAEILVGAVVGALAGANIRLALAPERVSGFLRGAVTGATAGFLLVLAQGALVALAASFSEYRVFYQPLLVRFSGILFVATVIGAAAGMLKAERSLAAPMPGAVVGVLTAAAFVLPVVANTSHTIFTSDWAWANGLSLFVSNIFASQVSTLAASSGSGAIIGATIGRRGLGGSNNLPATAGVLLGTVTAVTGSSASFHYVILGLIPSESSFSPELYVFRVLVGLLCGVGVGLVVAFAAQRVTASRDTDAGMIAPD